MDGDMSRARGRAHLTSTTLGGYSPPLRTDTKIWFPSVEPVRLGRESAESDKSGGRLPGR